MEVSHEDYVNEIGTTNKDVSNEEKAITSNACFVGCGGQHDHLNLKSENPLITGENFPKYPNVQQNTTLKQEYDQLVDVVVVHSENMMPSVSSQSIVCSNHFVISQQDYETLIIRQNMGIWKLLRDTPFQFTLPEIIDSSESSTNESSGDGAFMDNNSSSEPQQPMHISKRKTKHIPRAEFVDKTEDDQLEKGKALIEKMPTSLVEKCDIVRTALFLTLCNVDNLTA